MSETRKIRRALLSVFDKTGLVEFARALHGEFGIELISTGGTARTLKDAGLPVTLVEEITGFPEMMDGRVKTLHPRIHAAILADRDNPEHMRQLAEQGIEPIDMVVVNLYPFEKTVADPNCTFEQAIEMIDIGGPCLLRAAAKNQEHVLVLHDMVDCRNVLTWLRGNELTDEGWQGVRRDYAASTFRLVCAYNAGITDYLLRQAEDKGSFHALLMDTWDRPRYGENPHQMAEVLRAAPGLDLPPGPHVVGLNTSRFRCESEMSFNNYVDASAALELCAELTRAGTRHMWHRLSAGAPDQRRLRSNATEPDAGAGAKHRRAQGTIDDELLTRRNLPHIQYPGATYFITFRLRHGELTPAERDVVLEVCTYWQGRKLTLHAATVMPDHVHLLLTPSELPTGETVALGEILQSIKGNSARAVNKLRGKMGRVWMDESFDRIIRNAGEFIEKWEYMEANPVTAGLVDEPGQWRWFWRSETGYGEQLVDEEWLAHEHERAHRLKAGATESGAGATESGASATESGASATELPVVCFIKHTNACGAAVAVPRSEAAADATSQAASDVQRARVGEAGVQEPGTPEARVHKARVRAYRDAYLGDPNAAMGGILAVNFPVDAEFAAVVMETLARFGKPLKDAGHPAPPGAFFVEVWLAPRFTDDAVALIRGTYEPDQARPESGEARIEKPPKKKWGGRVRLLAVGEMGIEPDPNEQDYKRIAGGMLVQDKDLVGLNEEEWQVVTERAPTPEEMDDLRLAWLVCKHTKSNAITICKDGRLIGNGAGQMSRVMSCRVATWAARDNGHELDGAVAASDAFFPFRDGPDILMNAGVQAIIQPGGSKNDQQTIDACNERGVAMIFTRTRHFKH